MLGTSRCPLGPSPPGHSNGRPPIHSLSTAHLLSIKAGARQSCHSYLPLSLSTENIAATQKSPGGSCSYWFLPQQKSIVRLWGWDRNWPALLGSRFWHPTFVLQSVFFLFQSCIFSRFLLFCWISGHQLLYPLFLVCFPCVWPYQRFPFVPFVLVFHFLSHDLNQTSELYISTLELHLDSQYLNFVLGQTASISSLYSLY